MSVIIYPEFNKNDTIVLVDSKIDLKWRISGSKGEQLGNLPVYCTFNTNIQVILLDSDK